MYAQIIQKMCFRKDFGTKNMRTVFLDFIVEIHVRTARTHAKIIVEMIRNVGRNINGGVNFDLHLQTARSAYGNVFQIIFLFFFLRFAFDGVRGLVIGDVLLSEGKDVDTEKQGANDVFHFVNGYL